MCRFVISLMCLLAFGLEACVSQERNPSSAQQPAAEAAPAGEKSADQATPADEMSAARAALAKKLLARLDPNDPISAMQANAIVDKKSAWGHWGNRPGQYSGWTSHSNRLIPVYTFGITIDPWREAGSAYADPQRLQQLYGRVPAGSVNPTATYYDQTELYQLQLAAVEAGYRHIIVMIFDGMDWQTTRAAALYKQRRLYDSGRGTGLSFQDDRRIRTDFGLVCTSPWSESPEYDVNAQTVISSDGKSTGGYDPLRGGEAPWQEVSGRDYLMGTDREQPHTVTDSAASATSICSGIKTYNGAINVAADGTHVIPIARKLQAERGFKVGLVSSVPVSHATVAACYANNVTRKDYQDLSRDLLGLPSSSHRSDPLPGVDVLIGGGWGETKQQDTGQGDNYLPGNLYLHAEDFRRLSRRGGGPYLAIQRTAGRSGGRWLMLAARRAANRNQRLLGLFGVQGGHLPYQTANGRYDPTIDVKAAEQYSKADIYENPTLAEMTAAALRVLERANKGFWLMVEAGDVDWANHSNNLDNSIGAVLSGEAAFNVIMDWVDAHNAWSDTAVIVTADHGHYLVIDDPERIIEAGTAALQAERKRSKNAASGQKIDPGKNRG